MKIIHLVLDDKFIDAAIREFEVVRPQVNEYFILDARPPFRYLRDARIRTVSKDGWAARMSQGDVAAVVLHGLPTHHHPLLHDVPEACRVIWLGWGYDYYGLLNDAFPDGLFLPATRHVVSRMRARAAHHVPGRLDTSELSVGRPYPKPSLSERQVLQRVDYISALPQEYRMVRRHQPWFRAELLPWFYLTLEDDLVTTPTMDRAPGRNILVGNSATPTNNHLEAFERLRQLGDLEGRSIVVPLNYGDTKYADMVATVGRDMFGDALFAVREFMPNHEYVALLQSCSMVVMNHVRQQAIGNLLIAGLHGARLFLNRRNPAGRWLEAQGVLVGDIDALTTEPLTATQRAANIAAIRSFSERRARRKLTAALIDTALGASTSADTVASATVKNPMPACLT